jgi:restriction endonuclease Mrr
MLPLLVRLSDDKEHSNQETLKSLAEQFNLSDDELTQLLPRDCNRYLPTELHGLRAT